MARIFGVGEKPTVCKIRVALVLISVLVFTNVVVPDVAAASQPAQESITLSTLEIATVSGVVLPLETTPGAVTPTDPITTEPAVTAPAIFDVKLKANGGGIGKAKAKEKIVKVEKGQKIGKLPKPKQKYHKFLGWYTEKKGGKKVTAKTKVVKAMTLYAHWQRERLDVPLHPQFPAYPSGCEAASVSMLVSYATGKNISVGSVVAHTSYRGNPRGWSAYTVPGDMLSPIRHYVGNAKNLSGAKLSTIKKYINRNKPVVVWARVPGVGFHCICVVGYSKDYIYYNDPWRGSIGGKNKKVKTATFERWWSSLHRWAVSY